MGRPSRYTTKLGETICKRLAEGESLRAICRDDDMPDRSTVRAWLASDATMYAGFHYQYARARDEQADGIFDRMRETAADESIDVQRARLMLDTDKWWLGKVKPKKYGTERFEHAGDPDAPLVAQIQRVNRPSKTALSGEPTEKTPDG